MMKLIKKLFKLFKMAKDAFDRYCEWMDNDQPATIAETMDKTIDFEKIYKEDWECEKFCHIAGRTFKTVYFIADLKNDCKVADGFTTKEEAYRYAWSMHDSNLWVVPYEVEIFE